MDMALVYETRERKLIVGSIPTRGAKLKAPQGAIFIFGD